MREWKALDRRRTQQAAVLAQQRKDSFSRLALLSRIEKSGARLTLALLAIMIVVAGFYSIRVHQSELASSYYLSPYSSSPNPFSPTVEEQLLFVAPAMGLLLVSLLLSYRTGMLVAIVMVLLIITPTLRYTFWPESSAVLTHWSVVFTCVVPGLLMDLAGGLGVSHALRSRWAAWAGRTIDHALFPLCAVAALLSTPRPNSDVTFLWLFIGGLIAVIGWQLTAIWQHRPTLGEWWVGNRSSDKDDPSPRSQRLRFARAGVLFASFGIACGGWFAWAMGLDGFSPLGYFGNAALFLIHVATLGFFYWRANALQPHASSRVTGAHADTPVQQAAA